jgi:hypothetical protein
MEFSHAAEIKGADGNDDEGGDTAGSGHGSDYRLAGC